MIMHIANRYKKMCAGVPVCLCALASHAQAPSAELPTGDLNFSLPAMVLPTAEQPFILNVDYRSSISAFTDASWTGLGWNLSPGAIGRTVKGFPDDVRNRAIETHNEGTAIAEIPTQQPANFIDEFGWTVLKYESPTEPHPYISTRSKIERMYGALYLGEEDLDGHVVHPTWNTDCYEESCNSDYNTPLVRNTSSGSWGRAPFFKDYWSEDMQEYEYPVSDVYQENPGGDEHTLRMGPVHIAFDEYHVAAGDISGKLRPFRGDIGSVSVPDKYPYQAGLWYRNHVLAPWLNSEDEGYAKPSFYYTSQTNNYYDHQLGNTTVADMQIDISNGHALGCSPNVNHQIRYTLEDDVLYNTSNRTEERLTAPMVIDNLLAQAKYVRWFSNSEISTGTATASGFIDFKYGSERTSYRASHAAEGIGGFMITNENGYTYHFALPVYSKNLANYVDVTGQLTEHNWSKIAQEYALTWELTAITGPDFIESGNTGYIDGTERGYWVKFNYGLFSGTFETRFPYDFKISENGGSIKRWSYSEVERYYLNTIETKDHIAAFVKSLRTDGKGYYDNGVGSPQSSSSLRLDEIVVYDRETYNGLAITLGNTTTQNNTLGSGDTYNNVLDNYNWSVNYATYPPLMRVKFNYNYSLAVGNPGSFSNPKTPPSTYGAGGSGKLCLASMEYSGTNTPIHGAYFFAYSSNNPNYSTSKWDEWFMYSANALTGYPVATGGSGDHWCLVNIETPTGAEYDIAYAKDTYRNVNGKTADTQATPISNTAGGNNRVTSISVTDSKTGETYQSIYEYYFDKPNNKTSGVATSEPAYERETYDKDFDFYHDPNILSPAVYYSDVQVYEGYVSATDYLSRTDYQFFVPEHSRTSYESSVLANDNFTENTDGICFGPPDETINHEYYARNHRVWVTEGVEGNILDKKVYNAKGHLLNTTNYNYNATGWVGSGTLLSEKISSDFYEKTHKLIRTHTAYRTYQMVKTKYTDHQAQTGVTTTIEDLDDNTGLPLKSATSGDDIIYDVSRTVPAYVEYPAMGSKYANESNTHQVAAMTKQYLYYHDRSNTANTQEIVEATVQTWSNTWKDRSLNSSTCTWSDLSNNEVWRPKSSYDWKGLLGKQGDGTYKTSGTGVTPFVDYSYVVSASNLNWRKVDENTRIDLDQGWQESMDVNGNYVAQKLGYDGKLPVAEASNCRYTELYYTSAEDYSGTPCGHFGGELKVHSTDIIHIATNNAVAHTGAHYMTATNGNDFTVLNAISVGTLGTDQLDSDKTYKASVWMHQSGAAQGQLYFTLTNGSQNHTQYAAINDADTYEAGDWYQFNLEIPIVDCPFTPTSITVGVRTTGVNAIFDDFRFCPGNAVMTSRVFDEKTGRVLAEFDDLNFGVKYEYDEYGNVSKTWREYPENDINSGGGFRKTSESIVNVAN